ncbi:hypothetical protein BDV93DRAFT_440133 [Ceratobasidium sp. AG-I]|nr:hypothetical protein BDV93DRAFT_440133 [Ceratobasidium sp. AG-I]
MLDDHRGQEFARDATIWPQYAKEAESYDRGLVKEQRKSLDMILITAVAFCVVLGIFLLKSQDILQQDPANASLALLLLIAQSQHRIERGLPPLESESAPAIFGFAPPVTARWINGIWVTSFSLSLSAAMLAMLAKQWLINFLAARPLYGHDYARQRQSRLEGLDKWRALHIIAIIPSLLHISIILFATGLVIHLWILDIACAVALVVIVGITILFHFVTTVLGVAYEFCPFVTNISKYLRREDITFKDSTMLDIRAVLWLANHSRNSVVVDSSYQALAGLHRSTEANPNASATDNSSFVIPHHLDNGTTTISLLQTMMRRFERLATSSFHLSTFEETSLVRHLNSMLLLASHLRSSPHHASENQIHESGMKSDPNNVLAATKFRTGLPVSSIHVQFATSN